MNAQTKVEAATCPAVYSAITAVMERMSKEGIGKGRKNTQQGYQFRGIDDVYNTLCGVLAENKLMMLPFVVEMTREERQTKSGGALNYTILTVDFKLVSSVDGSFDTVRIIGEAMDSADKSSNKSQSAAHKYAALQVFMIPTEGDNDADASTPEVLAKSKEPDAPAEMPDAEWANLVQLTKAAKADTTAMLKHYGVKSLRHLNQEQYGHAVGKLKDKIAEMAKAETNAKAQAETGGEFADLDADSIPY